jgi:hypothetical protein
MKLNFLNLGIVYSQFSNGLYHMVGHRSLLKVVLNPFLRIFKYQIGSVISGDYREDPKDFEIDYLMIDKMDRRVFNFKDSWVFKLRDGDKILTKRMFY